jgi:hypothetical protein
VGVECRAIGRFPLTENRLWAPLIHSDTRDCYWPSGVRSSARATLEPGCHQQEAGAGEMLLTGPMPMPRWSFRFRLHQTDARLLRAIEEAFARIRQGTYGVCVVCKQPIAKARLEAVPWKRVCRECQERQAA